MTRSRSPLPAKALVVGLALVFLTGACGEARPQGPGNGDDDDAGGTGDLPPSMGTMLIDHTKWAQVAEADDPLADHRPEGAYCDLENGTLMHPSGTFDVIMDYCPYFMAGQPSLADVSEGDCIEIPFLHGDLISPEGGIAHVALLFGADVFWERNFPIPSAANVAYSYWSATADIPAGTPISYHVHNHGPNMYALGDVAILPRDLGESCPPMP